MQTDDVRELLDRVSRECRDRMRSAASPAELRPVAHGRVVEAVGTLVRATGVRARVGELCSLSDLHTGFEGSAEVVGFVGADLWLSPMGNLDGISPSTRVTAAGRVHAVPVGDFLLGRVVDGMGLNFLDEGAAMPAKAPVLPVWGSAPAALDRPPIRQRVELGVRALDGLLTMGLGQRVGIFAAAGCGKSTLASMLCRHAQVDVTIVALVGERGREVADFLADGLTPGSRSRSVMVVATSDRPATERLKAAFVATTYAEHFRRRGKSVLLLVDSVTRLARAAREIGLAAGEPPTRRGFPPSVFSLLPRLFERTGLTREGAITAFYTVLEETDDGSDPIGEEVRSLLDGTVVLSRKLAHRGHFPAIDVLSSISRLMPRLVSREHETLARRARELMAKYDDVELLLRIGEYQRGVDATADAAIDCRGALDAFLRQEVQEKFAQSQTLRQLMEAVS
jgi:ATP synthase in type III secretion protein N